MNAKVQISWPVISRDRSSWKVNADLFLHGRLFRVVFSVFDGPTAGRIVGVRRM